MKEQPITSDVPAALDDRAELDWIKIPHCPACGGASAMSTRLYNQRFHFGDAAVPPPDAPISLMTCGDCALVFKDRVPSPMLLAKLTAATQDHLWTSNYDYTAEVALAVDLGANTSFDLLDVGAAGGEFLRAVPTAGRKSALDIARFVSLEITGEFITGFLDTPDLAWSGVPYRVVTVFDVLEHLYDPLAAMRNLARFVGKEGYVVVETGDSEAAGSRLASWYYINGVDHHMAWNQQSFSMLADASGFEVISFDRKPHKMAGNIAETWKSRLKLAAFQLIPALYRAAYHAMGRPISMPREPRMSDHFRAVLRTRR